MRSLLAAAVAALTLAGCATIPRVDAAQDIHALMVAIRDGDRQAFDAHVDREALKTQMRARVLAEAARSNAGGATSLQALGAFLAGPLVDVAVDAFLRPEVFRAVAEMRGYSPSRPIPSSLAIAQFVKPLGDGTACVVERKGGPCLLDFRNEEGTWRLTGFEGDLSLLRPRVR
jgi:hypothetical protein